MVELVTKGSEGEDAAMRKVRMSVMAEESGGVVVVVM